MGFTVCPDVLIGCEPLQKGTVHTNAGIGEKLLCFQLIMHIFPPKMTSGEYRKTVPPDQITMYYIWLSCVCLTGWKNLSNRFLTNVQKTWRRGDWAWYYSTIYDSDIVSNYVHNILTNCEKSYKVSTELHSGPRGRKFKSSHSDQNKMKTVYDGLFVFGRSVRVVLLLPEELPQAEQGIQWG